MQLWPFTSVQAVPIELAGSERWMLPPPSPSGPIMTPWWRLLFHHQGCQSITPSFGSRKPQSPQLGEETGDCTESVRQKTEYEAELIYQ
jgi:hypothetical protein